MSILYKIFGDPNEKVLAALEPVLEDVNMKEPEIEKLSPSELKEASLALKARIQKGESLDSVLVEAFALCREGRIQRADFSCASPRCPETMKRRAS